MSVVLKQDRLVSAEELYASPEFRHHKKVEIWRGNPIVMSPTQHLHSRVVGEILFLLKMHFRNNPELEVGTEALGFLLDTSPDLLLCPDVSVFFRIQIAQPWIKGSPLIAIEVLSPNNSMPEMMAKKDYFLRYGAEQFWLVDPGKRTIDIYHRDRQLQCLSGNARLEFSEGTLAGLVLQLEDVFRGINASDQQ